jgi:hypothetical protein
MPEMRIPVLSKFCQPNVDDRCLQCRCRRLSQKKQPRRCPMYEAWMAWLERRAQEGQFTSNEVV